MQDPLPFCVRLVQVLGAVDFNRQISTNVDDTSDMNNRNRVDSDVARLWQGLIYPTTPETQYIHGLKAPGGIIVDFEEVFQRASNNIVDYGGAGVAAVKPRVLLMAN